MVRTLVNATHNDIRNQVSQSALSVALLIGSALWFVGCLEYCATSALRNDWSATPLAWVLIVMVIPALCFAIGVILVDRRKRTRFSRLDWCALMAGVFPVTLGTFLAVWAVKVLLSMSGVGV